MFIKVYKKKIENGRETSEVIIDCYDLFREKQARQMKKNNRLKYRELKRRSLLEERKKEEERKKCKEKQKFEKEKKEPVDKEEKPSLQSSEYETWTYEEFLAVHME